TTSPNRLMASLHDRMPVIVPPDQYNLWLDRRVEDPRRLAPLLVPYNADEMEAYEVSAAVNKPSHDEPDCIAPLA
ncbi:MAG TPA: SOS response-associated peptidase family protein, partial [Pirellulales bacterium]